MACSECPLYNHDAWGMYSSWNSLFDSISTCRHTGLLIAEFRMINFAQLLR